MKKHAVILGSVVVFSLQSSNLFGQHRNDQQTSNPRDRRVYLGAGLGYARNIVDGRIGNYPLFATFLEFPLKAGVQLRSKLEYFQAKDESPFVTFEYKDIEYIGLFSQLWRNISLETSAKFAVSNISYLGTGLCLDMFAVKRSRPEYKGFRPFVVDPFDDTVKYFFEESNVTRFAIGFVAYAGLEPSVDWILQPVVEIQYRMVFVGREFGKTPLNVQSSLSGHVGIKYGFE
jgi:hypothetical protein